MESYQVPSLGSFAIENDGVEIDIGEATKFFVKCTTGGKYEPMFLTQRSACFKVTYTNCRVEVLRVTWCKSYLFRRDTSHAVSELAGNIVRVPRCYYHGVVTHGSSTVEILVREFIPGEPLSQAWFSLSQAQRERIVHDVANVALQLRRITSSYFGLVAGVACTHDSVGYLRALYRAEETQHKVPSGNMAEFTRGSDQPPTLCHCNLSPEHILVSGEVLSGIVGWGKAEFIPPYFENAQYILMQASSVYDLWYPQITRRLREGTLTESAEYAKAWLRHKYLTMWCGEDAVFRPALTSIYTAALAALRAEVPCMSGDETSQSIPLQEGSPHKHETFSRTITPFDFDTASVINPPQSDGNVQEVQSNSSSETWEQ